MKHPRYFLIPAAVVLTAGFSGCKPESEEETPVKTVFELTQDTVTVAAEGGQASVGYKLEGAQEGASVQPDYTADWLGDFDASVEGTITFNVAANETEAERETEVTVTYADQQDSFVVLQAAAGGGEEPDPDSPFDISVRVEDGSAYVSVVPLDKTITYDCEGITASSLNMFPDDLAFVEEYLIPYYRELAGANSMTIQDLMGQILVTGDQTDIQLGGLTADTEYYAFCIGLTTSCEITTEFVKEPFKTEPLQAFDAQIDVTVDGASAVVTVTPADEEAGYLVPLVFEGQGHDDDALVASAQQYVENSVWSASMFGMTREQAIANITKRGTQSYPQSLSANTDYTAATFTISTNGTVTSRPVKKEFETGDVNMSDNVLTVEFTSIQGRRVDFTVWASNDEDPYTFFMYNNSGEWKEYWESMTDEEIIEYIISDKNVDSYIRHGDIASYETQLRPLTDYVVFAFGYEAGVATTQLFRGDVTTEEAVLNDSKFSYEFGPYYNGTEAAEKYPDQLAGAAGRAVFPATYKVDGEWYGIWHKLYEGDLTDETEYPDEDVYQALKAQGNTWLSSTVQYIVDFDKEYTLCGFVETMDGNFSELYRMKVGPFTLEGCSPIDEYNPQFAPAQAQSVSEVKAFSMELPTPEYNGRTSVTSVSMADSQSDVLKVESVSEDSIRLVRSSK